MFAYSEWLVVAMAVTALVVWAGVALWGVLVRLRRGVRGELPPPPAAGPRRGCRRGRS